MLIRMQENPRYFKNIQKIKIWTYSIPPYHTIHKYYYMNIIELIFTVTFFIFSLYFLEISCSFSFYVFLIYKKKETFIRLTEQLDCKIQKLFCLLLFINLGKMYGRIVELTFLKSFFILNNVAEKNIRFGIFLCEMWRYFQFSEHTVLWMWCVYCTYIHNIQHISIFTIFFLFLFLLKYKLYELNFWYSLWTTCGGACVYIDNLSSYFHCAFIMSNNTEETISYKHI